MKNKHDPWYIRLPDGRIVKAKSTSSVRHHVEAGNIPLNSTARRDLNEEWVALPWISEFADMNVGQRTLSSLQEQAPAPTNGSAPEVDLKSGISSRLDPMRLQTVGIRGLVDELIAAFDSTVTAGKLVISCIAGVVAAFVVFLISRAVLFVYPEGPWLAHLLSGMAGFLVLAVTVAVLTRQTHMELSMMRPVYPRETWKGIGSYVLRIFLGYAVTIGLGVCFLLLLQNLTAWVGRATGSSSPMVADLAVLSAWCLALVLYVAIFAIILLSFLVPPILVVEECSLPDAIREWRALLREHRIRVLVYEGMALALSFVAALPLMLPVQLALLYGPPLPDQVGSYWMGSLLPSMLHGLAIGPAIAFLAVANLFIYLNLRYEYSPQK